MAYNPSALRRVYTQAQASFRTIPNTTGTWTPASPAVKLLRDSRCSLNFSAPKIEADYHTGTRSRPSSGLIGRRVASWDIAGPLIPSGAAGTAPDAENLLAAVFGRAGVIVGATSCTYSFLDAGFLPFLINYLMLAGTGFHQRIAWGCWPEEITFELMGDFMSYSARGGACWVLDSDSFAAVEETVAKAGLTVNFGTEVGQSNTVAGNLITGYTLTNTFDGNAMVELQGATIKVQTGFRPEYAAADPYPITAIGGRRRVSVSFRMLDSDSSNLTNLKKLVKSGTPLDITISNAVLAGYKVSFTLQDVRLESFEMAGGEVGFTSEFGESSAHASSLTAIDDLTIAFT